jgi:anaerobic selenocysteine-containing dehydrogenase
MAQVLFEEGLVDLGAAGEYVNGLDDVLAAVRDFTPEVVARVTGISADTIRRLARDLADAAAAAVYGRIGTCTQEFGTVASWLVDVVNTLTGNLDKPGGAMFPKPAAGGINTRGTPRYGRGVTLGRHTSRVRGLPETYGEIPVSCLSDEIETQGDGQVRALVTIAGNPALSTPNSRRLDNALASLEFMVSIDMYINETTRHADVVLPTPSPLTKSHYDIGFYQFAIRNIANFSPAVLPLADGEMEEWRILATLTLIAQGAGADADPALVDDQAASSLAASIGIDLAELGPRIGPDRLVDLMLRGGPYGLTLDKLLENPHGIDLGPLEPRLPELLRTPSGMIELAPPTLIADVERLRASLLRSASGGLVLIGRRHVRSNNSWMHNVNVLVKGKERCTLQVHPDDARRLGLGTHASVRSRVGQVIAPVEVTDVVMPGVVSLPHGWGHDLDGVEMAVARSRAGVNSNVLTDEELYDPVSGNAVLNGIPVEVAPA